MAIFQPGNVAPDVRSGLGLGVVDADEALTVSWRINGQSALTQFEIRIFSNDAASTLLLDTTELNGGTPLSDGCPAYGTGSAGEILFFSYTVPSADLAGAGIVNGGEYKLVIRQWWSASESVTQSSASVFVTRAAPTLSVAPIGTDGVVGARFYRFSGVYSQAQGDVLNHFRWRVAYAERTGTPLFDSGNISGTMDISCFYDGFFTGERYAVRLTAQTEHGAEADTGWVEFSVSYPLYGNPGEIAAVCAADAVRVSWDGFGYVPGVATGEYSISDDGVLTLAGEADAVTWRQNGVLPMAFDAPWSVIWKGKLQNRDCLPIFALGQGNREPFFPMGQGSPDWGQFGNDVFFFYDWRARELLLVSLENGILLERTGVANFPTVTAALTPDALYLRLEYLSRGVHPGSNVFPDPDFYPLDDTVETVETVSLPLNVSDWQRAISYVQIAGAQDCEFLEVVSGAASAAAIQAAIYDGDYAPGQMERDHMLADWHDGLNAGTYDVGGDTVQGFALYRRRGAEAALVKIAETGMETVEALDYGAASQQGPYTYYLFPVGTETYLSAPLVSGAVSPCWWSWALLACDETAEANIYSVSEVFRFRLNLSSGVIGNNNAPNLLKNFTPYPRVQLSPHNYKSGTLSGLIGGVELSDGRLEYRDTLALRDALYVLSTRQGPLFLKNRKGDLLRVRVAGPITMTTADATREQMQTVSLPWVEVGSAAGVSLVKVGG